MKKMNPLNTIVRFCGICLAGYHLISIIIFFGWIIEALDPMRFWFLFSSVVFSILVCLPFKRMNRNPIFWIGLYSSGISVIAFYTTQMWERNESLALTIILVVALNMLSLALTPLLVRTSRDS